MRYKVPMRQLLDTGTFTAGRPVFQIAATRLHVSLAHHCGHRPRLCGSAGRHGVRPRRLQGDRLRRQRRAHRRTAQRHRPDPRGLGRGYRRVRHYIHQHRGRSARGGFLHRDRADADRSRPRPGPVDAARRVANGRRARSSAATSSCTNRPSILERPKTPAFRCWSKLGTEGGKRLHRRLLAGADQSRRQRAQIRVDHQGRVRPGRGDARDRRRPPTERS